MKTSDIMVNEDRNLTPETKSVILENENENKKDRFFSSRKKKNITNNQEFRSLKKNTRKDNLFQNLEEKNDFFEKFKKDSQNKVIFQNQPIEESKYQKNVQSEEEVGNLERISRKSSEYFIQSRINEYSKNQNVKNSNILPIVKETPDSEMSKDSNKASVQNACTKILKTENIESLNEFIPEGLFENSKFINSPKKDEFDCYRKNEIEVESKSNSQIRIKLLSTGKTYPVENQDELMDFSNLSKNEDLNALLLSEKKTNQSADKNISDKKGLETSFSKKLSGIKKACQTIIENENEKSDKKFIETDNFKVFCENDFKNQNLEENELKTNMNIFPSYENVKCVLKKESIESENRFEKVYKNSDDDNFLRLNIEKTSKYLEISENKHRIKNNPNMSSIEIDKNSSRFENLILTTENPISFSNLPIESVNNRFFSTLGNEVKQVNVIQNDQQSNIHYEKALILDFNKANLEQIAVLLGTPDFDPEKKSGLNSEINPDVEKLIQICEKEEKNDVEYGNANKMLRFEDYDNQNLETNNFSETKMSDQKFSLDDFMKKFNKIDDKLNKMKIRDQNSIAFKKKAHENQISIKNMDEEISEMTYFSENKKTCQNLGIFPMSEIEKNVCQNEKKTIQKINDKKSPEKPNFIIQKMDQNENELKEIVKLDKKTQNSFRNNRYSENKTSKMKNSCESSKSRLTDSRLSNTNIDISLEKQCKNDFPEVNPEKDNLISDLHRVPSNLSYMSERRFSNNLSQKIIDRINTKSSCNSSEIKNSFLKHKLKEEEPKSIDFFQENFILKKNLESSNLAKITVDFDINEEFQQKNDSFEKEDQKKIQNKEYINSMFKSAKNNHIHVNIEKSNQNKCLDKIEKSLENEKIIEKMNEKSQKSIENLKTTPNDKSNFVFDQKIEIDHDGLTNKSVFKNKIEKKTISEKQTFDFDLTFELLKNKNVSIGHNIKHSRKVQENEYIKSLSNENNNVQKFHSLKIKDNFIQKSDDFEYKNDHISKQEKKEFVINYENNGSVNTLLNQNQLNIKKQKLNVIYEENVNFMKNCIKNEISKIDEEENSFYPHLLKKELIKGHVVEKRIDLTHILI